MDIFNKKKFTNQILQYGSEFKGIGFFFFNDIFVISNMY